MANQDRTDEKISKLLSDVGFISGRIDGFVTHKQMLKGLAAAGTLILVGTGVIGGLVHWGLSAQIKNGSSATQDALRPKIEALDARISDLERRIVASIDGGFDRLHAQLGTVEPLDKASIVAWKPTGDLDLPPDFSALAEMASPVGIYTISPDVWQVSGETPTDKLEALQLLISGGVLEPVRPDGQ